MAQKVKPFDFAGSTMNIGESWWPFIQLQSLEPYFIQVKVVILGQDPYYKPQMMGSKKSVAHGLAFSLLPGTPMRSSLRNIFTELQYEYPNIDLPNHGFLMGWAKQGVLLLNTWLTVEDGKPKSHRSIGWEFFTGAVISLLKSKSGIVFILWGQDAQDMYDMYQSCSPGGMHYILKGNHPSFKSAYPKPHYAGFFSYRHDVPGHPVRNLPVPMYFRDCNDYLLTQGKTPINWGFLPGN